MDSNKDMMRSIAAVAEMLSKNGNHSQEELITIGKQIPLSVMTSGMKFARYAVRESLSIVDATILITWFRSLEKFLTDIKVYKDMPYDDAAKYYEAVRTNTIVLHRLNYMLHQCMLDVYNILERDKRLKMNVKRAYLAAEGKWRAYFDERKHNLSESTWYTLYDHLRLADEAVSEERNRVYESIRDNMIANGMRDVEVKALCVVAFLQGKVVKASYDHFFKSFREESGIDFQKCFDDISMLPMLKNFAELAENFGVTTHIDDYGCYVTDYNPEDVVRFGWAWRDYITLLRDDDLMDRCALNAININPDTKEEYEHIKEREAEQELQESIERLSEKFNVKIA